MNPGTRIRIKSNTIVATDWVGYHGIVVLKESKYFVVRLIYRNTHMNLSHGTLKIENDALEEI